MTSPSSDAPFLGPEVLGAAIHDLKNLLNAILTSAEACRLQVEDESAEQFLERISHAAERGSSLTHNVLAQLADEQHTESPEAVPVKEVVRKTCDMLAPIVSSDIRMEIEPWTEALSVRIHQEHLEEIMLNLIQNAIEAIEGSGQITIRISHTVLTPDDSRCLDGRLQAGRYVSIEIEDTGGGMEPEVQARVSEAFFTTHGEDTSDGLGGWIVSRLIERWGGWITYESEPGEGTLVSMLLPRAESEAPDNSDAGSTADVG